MMQIKLQRGRVFTNNPSTLAHEALFFSFPRESRFKHNSIYQGSLAPPVARNCKEDLGAFLQKIKLTLGQNYNFSRSAGGEPLPEERPKSRSPNRIPKSKVEACFPVVDRLYTSRPSAGQPIHDKFGNSSYQMQIRNTKCQREKGQKPMSLTARERFFTMSRRLDLSRPLNFNPGPGQYDQGRRVRRR